MKILIADSFPEVQQAALTAQGHSVTFSQNLSGETLQQALAEHEILIVRSTKVEAAALDAGTCLKLVIRAGAGTNTIDKTHAATRNIRVCNVPGANSIAVAELVLGLIIAIDRNIADNVIDLRNQQWHKKRYSKAGGLYGCTLGILGFGAIGLAVATRARAFGMQVCVTAKPNRSTQAQQDIANNGIVELASMEELLGSSDIVSLHLPLTAQTDKLVNHAFLAKMKEGAILINTSRGGLIDETALISAMQSNGIRVGLDVYQDEPTSSEGQFISALANHPNVCGTHHIGASTTQAQNAVADGTLRVIDSFIQGKLLYCVND